MVWHEILKLLGLFALSGTKFLMAPGAILAAGYPVAVSMIVTFLGGSAGSVFFFRAGKGMFSWIERYLPGKKKKRVFTKRNRMLIRFKNRFGVIGLAFLIPLISIPVSALIAAKYFRHDRKAVPAYIGSSAFWSVILTFFSNPIIRYMESIL